MTYQLMGSPRTMAFATDNRGRRTDTWLDANADRSAWVAHSHTDYDTSGRVSRVTAKRGTGNTSNTTVFDMSYCYLAGSTPGTCSTTNNAVNDRAKLQWTKDHVTGAVTTYTYDKKGQLTKAVVTGGPSPATHEYKYDARGNRETATASTPYPAQNYSYNPDNQNTSTGFAYDGTGNLTADPSGTTYTYNGAQQMTKVTRAGTTYNYTYAGADQTEALSMESSRGNYQYAYGRTDQFGQPIIERVTKDGGVGYVENDPVTGQALSLHTPGGMQSMYVYDGIGNPVALITNANTVATAYSYDPYGVAKLTTDSGGQGTPYNPYQFKGGIHDRTTNWIKFGHRWYSTEWGRFTQMDTLDAPLDSGNANRYAFAANDPINNADPTGLIYFAVGISACFIGCIQGGINIDDDFDLYGGVGFGPKGGVDIDAGLGSGRNEGAVFSFECSVALGYGGGSIQIPLEEKTATPTGLGFSYSTGAAVGCGYLKNWYT